MIRLLLTTGRGPAECRIALARTLKIMAKEAATAELNMDVISGPAPDAHGPASAIAVVEGEGDAAEAFVQNWKVSVQWRFRSPIRPHHKRKNWFIGVVALSHEERATVQINIKDVRFDTFRAGGPGGQHQNTTDSAVRAVHVPTGLAVVARSERSQHRNKATALARLATVTEQAHALAALSDQSATQDAHDQLVRGQPVRTFRNGG